MTTNPALGRALVERDYTNPTPVQLAVLAPEAAGRDLLVSAQTGSGKTVAYGLAMAETLLGTDEHFEPAVAPQALVVAPTRELALQVQREFVWLYGATGARIVSCVGGMDPRQEQRQLNQGAHIVIGTPGRLRDHLERGRLDISAIQVVVLDEADEMLDLGFREDLEFILDATPPQRRSLLFSATLPRGISALARRYQTEALRIDVPGAEGGHADIEYRVIRVAPKQTEHTVVNVLRFYDATSAIVFCNTREAVRHMQATLQERQFSAVALSGELSQNERNLALQALRDGRARVCVATDVAARGIDLPSLGLVIHADLPNDAESLQHRSGRTGRAGRKGTSVLLVPPFRRRRAQDLLAGLGVTTEWSGPPTADEIRKLDHERMLQDPLVTEAPGEDDATAAQALLAAHAPEHLAAALARLYRARLPAPEDVEDPGEPRSARATRAALFDGPSSGGGGGWFRLGVGHRQNADPRWLLPLICRRGNVTRKDIGAIRIFDEETAFEVSGAALEQFRNATRKTDGSDIRIEPLSEAPAGRGTRSPSRAKPTRERHSDDRQAFERPASDRRAFDKPTSDRRAQDRPDRDRSGGDRFVSDRPAPDRGAYEKKGRERAYRKAEPAEPAPAPSRFKKAREDQPRHSEADRHDPRASPAGKPKEKPKGKAKGKPDGAPKGKPAGKSGNKPLSKPHRKGPRHGAD